MREEVNRMTEGPIRRKIVGFAIPVFFGQLFQQFYNIADSMVVGNFSGTNALAAVSSSGNLIFLIVGFLTGVFMGAGVVLAQAFGAKDYTKLHAAAHTTIAISLIGSVFLAVFGILMSPTLLRWMKTPEEVLPNSVLYFRLIFCGIPFVSLYNVGTAIFNAVGDSRHPLIYLIISSLSNIALDLLFVAVFRWGVAGAAIATILAQLLSAVLAFHRLTRTTEVHRVNFREVRFYPGMANRILRYGIPSGVQNSIISFANVVVQTNINSFGEYAMAGCGIYSKVEGFGFLPITSFNSALTTFVGQNLGAGDRSRVKKGSVFGVAACVIIAEAIGLIISFTMPYIALAFNRDPSVVAFAAREASINPLFYCLLAYTHTMGSVLRGAGKPTPSMVIMLICWCVIRVSYITITVHFIPVIEVIFWAYPLTWTLSSIALSIYFATANWLGVPEKKAV